MKKALILVDHGSVVDEANAMLEQVAGLVAKSEKNEFDIVKYAHMELAPPTLSDVFDECVGLGARHVVVHPYFLAPGRHSTDDIPRMARDAAAKHRGVKYSVTEPLGVHAHIVEVILERVSGTDE